jgi:benzoyl-CoA reductase/2-hydroxyglutaryl-CoA dehydratase subunit BcrC/BadD/HgdB
MDKQNKRLNRLRARIQGEVQREYESARRLLERRDDYHPVWDYFLDLLMRLPNRDALRAALGRPVVEHLCNQAPYELFHAMGVHPLRMGSGCFAAGRLTTGDFPVLMCPMLKAVAGMQRLQAAAQDSPPARVVPTTCDWVVQYQQMTEADAGQTCFLELPHLRESERGQRRWLEEIYQLVHFLEGRTGRRLKRNTLRTSVRTFMHAWQALGRLIEQRRAGRLPAVWFLAVVNSFMLDPIEPWTEQLHRVVAHVDAYPSTPSRKGIYMAGAPILFPNFKLPLLIEAAGMAVLGDDLCTSERIWPGAVCPEEASFHGLMRALAERYHTACICPSFADNERRINAILGALRHDPFHGVVYHVLKGCHPFDIESFRLERQLKAQGVPFLRIETDYVEEDHRNIATRLEAFAEI